MAVISGLATAVFLLGPSLLNLEAKEILVRQGVGKPTSEEI